MAEKRTAALVALGMTMALISGNDACAEGKVDKMRVSVLGVEAVRIKHGQKTIFIDAFAGGIPAFDVDKADLILVTHDDGDHFSAKKAANAAKKTGGIIVGPPSIAYPLLVDEKLPPGQLVVVYPKHFKKPVVREIRGVRIKVYQTEHDGDWNPIHVSYLVEMGGKKFFHTGDSSMIPEDDTEVKGLDVLFHVFNTKDASQISRLEDAQKKFNPRYLIPIHLLHCSWTMTPEDFKKGVEKRGLKGFVVIEDDKQVFELP